eukprot:TRINITY_DN11729_c0_g1_i2.p1 TRINITY_DN11729_c0_g1~~TRINITY_DN11729_c0_g1_i2.p1  ORF type:complete len:473 (-),score=48.41 TRINITY_DN11729_c0_g1_i2:163-1581(-)
MVSCGAKFLSRFLFEYLLIALLIIAKQQVIIIMMKNQLVSDLLICFQFLCFGIQCAFPNGRLFNHVDPACYRDVALEADDLNVDAGFIISEISGAVDAPCQRYPYLVSLQFKDIFGEKDGEEQFRFIHFCGGTLLSPNLVLTAAHCVYQKNDWQVKDVRMNNEAEGELYQDSVFVARQPCCRHMKGYQRIQAVKYYLPEGYSGDVVQGDDILILQLSEGFEYEGPFVKYQVKESDKDAPFMHIDKYTTVGFGATFGGEVDMFYDYVKYLQLALMTKMDVETCNELVETPEPISKQKNLCFFNNTADTCQGDSGGPVLRADWLGLSDIVGNADLDVQVGITSYGPDNSCGDRGIYPGVYTNVQFYEDWIYQIIKKANNQVVMTIKIPIIESILFPIQSTTEQAPITVPITYSRPGFCFLRAESGFCDAALPFYYFDSRERRCKSFIWSGCGGNKNRFETYADCLFQCNLPQND